jgi:hypothetical protein
VGKRKLQIARQGIARQEGEAPGDGKYDRERFGLVAGPKGPQSRRPYLTLDAHDDVTVDGTKQATDLDDGEGSG